MQRWIFALSSAALTFLVASMPALAQKKYDKGATDAEIKIGNIMPYSGPASAYGTIGRVEAAYFDKINAEGGINGRKVKFISYDDAYSPPKAVEQTRKLVEGDEVLLLFGALGTTSNSATQKYLNNAKIPQLFVATGASKFGDYERFPWTIGLGPTYRSEGVVYGKYIRDKHPTGKIAVLWQNDDSARDTVAGLKEGLGDKAANIVIDKPYEITDPTVDSHIVALKTSGADILVALVAPKAGAQTIRKVAELGWKPTFILANPATSVASVMKPAGIENGQGIISSNYLKDPNDPVWKDDPEIKAWSDFMDKYYPAGDKTNGSNIYGYFAAQVMAHVLKQCGDDLTRENVMKQATHIKNFTSGMLLPGVKVNTSPTDYYPVEQLRLMRFKGESWELFGDVIDAAPK